MPIADLRLRTEQLLTNANHIISALEDLPSPEEMKTAVLRNYHLRELVRICEEVMKEAEMQQSAIMAGNSLNSMTYGFMQTREEHRRPGVLVFGFVEENPNPIIKPHYSFRAISLLDVEGQALIDCQGRDRSALSVENFSRLVQHLQNSVTSGGFDKYLNKDPSELLFQSMVILVDTNSKKIRTHSMSG